MILNLILSLAIVASADSGVSFIKPQKSCHFTFLNIQMDSAIARPMTFRKTELQRKNNDIGPQQMGDITLVKWRELILNNPKIEVYIGIDAKGRFFQIVKYKESGRYFGQNLGGKNEFTDFFVLTNGTLIATNKSNDVFAFSSGLWENKKNYILVGARDWAIISALILGGLNLFAPEYNNILIAGNKVYYPLIDSSILASVGLSNFFRMLNRYYEHNTFPNGFVRLPFKFSNLKNLTEDLSAIKDFKIDIFDFLEKQDFEKLPPRLEAELTQEIEY